MQKYNNKPSQLIARKAWSSEISQQGYVSGDIVNIVPNRALFLVRLHLFNWETIAISCPSECPGTSELNRGGCIRRQVGKNPTPDQALAESELAFLLIAVIYRDCRLHAVKAITQNTKTKRPTQSTRKKSAVKYSAHNHQNGKRVVRFGLNGTHARHVYLVGDFNDWNPTAHPLEHNGDGTWSAELELSPGDHEYLYLTDGVWRPDPMTELVPNPFGGVNSIISVAENNGE